MGDEDTVVVSNPPAQPKKRRRATRRTSVPSTTSLSRYRLLRRLGAGGVGLVYAAHDPELDREVAIKLLRARPHQAGSNATDPQGDGRTRLLREAQALAKLAHPNVIAVYDVGSYDLSDRDLSRVLPDDADIPLQGVFVVMELVDGPTLTQWLRTPRSWRDILRTFVAAGWGLAAAHDQGFVHRDFKPGNVLVGTDGRVRVLDFGLTRAVDAAESMIMPVPTADDIDFGERLTSTGYVVGTPLYMAPEQHRGDPVDARTDQFSFCLSLYEALFGGFDDVDRDPERLLTWKLKGLAPVPESSPVPEPIVAAIRKGLRPVPDDRHPSMEVLLRIFERELRRPRRRWAALGTSAALAAVGGLWGARVLWPSCPDVGTQVAAIWPAEQREAVVRALVSTRAPFAERTAEAVTARLDGYARRWAADRRAICEAATSRGDATSVDDARLQCSERARQAFAATLEILLAADVEVLIAAVPSVDALPRLDCHTLTEVPPTPAPPDDDALATRVEEVRRTLLKARSLEEAGRYGEALSLARSVHETTQEIPYGPVQAEALLEVGVGLLHTAALERAVTTLQEAAHLAESLGHDEVVGRAAYSLVSALGGLGRIDEALTWYRHGQTALRRLPRSGRLQKALAANVGHLYRDIGRLEDARRAYTLAVNVETDDEDAGELLPLVCLQGLGVVDLLEGDYESARSRLDEALKRGEALLGPSHPVVAMIRVDLGSLHLAEGRLEAALTSFEQALSDFRAAHGPDHASVALAHHHLAEALHALERSEDALPHAEKALAIRKLTLRADHPDTLSSMALEATIQLRVGDVEAAIARLEHVAAAYETRSDEARLGRVLQNLGIALAETRGCGEAIGRLQRALDVLERAHGPRSFPTARVLLHLASCKVELAEDEAALDDLRVAEAMLEQALGPDDPRVAEAWALRGRALSAAGRTDAGIELIERALQAVDRDGGPLPRARVRVFMADALVERDRGRAHALMLEAKALLENAGPAGARHLEAVGRRLDRSSVIARPPGAGVTARSHR